jgi:hypothetical protein
MLFAFTLVGLCYFDLDRTRALERSKEQQRPRKRLQGIYLLHPNDLELSQNIDFHFYNSPDTNDNHSHSVFHNHVKKYHLYYSFPTYAAGFTYIFCHLPSVH